MIVSDRVSLKNLGDNAGADGTTALADSETQLLVHSDRGDQRALHVHVVARHNHLNALRQLDVAGNVGGTEVELRTVVVEERSMTAALFLLQNVNLT